MGKNLVLGTMILGALTSTVSAADLANKLGVGIKGGYSIPVFGNSFNDAADADLGYGGHISYNLGSYNRLEIGFFKSKFDEVDTVLDTYSLMHVVRTSGDSALSPIFGYGAGLTKIHDYSPKSLKLALLGRLGIEQQLGSNFTVSAYADYQWTSKILGDLPGSRGLHTVTPTLALNWYFGGHESLAYTEPMMRERDEVTTYAAASNINRDSDSDGILDANDKCPNTPANTRVTAYGCAKEERASMKINVEFPTGKATIDRKYNAHLKEVATFLKDNPETEVDVEGYTDSSGSWKVNEKLSQKRAEAVVNALARLGVDRSKLSAKGFGPKNPIADNATVEGRKENRRVVAEIKSTDTSIE